MGEAKIKDQQYEVVDINVPKWHPRNPRRGDKEAIAESIRTNDFYGAIQIQRSTGFVIAGNHRWQAAREVGLTEIPAIFMDVDDEEATRILLADNRTSDKGTYDTRELADLLIEMESSSIGLAGTGYTDDDLASLITQLEEPTFNPDTDQPRLDQRKKVECPSCGTIFEPEK